MFVGWCHAHELVSYLREHGARIAAIERGIEVEWVAQNGDGELSSAENKDTSPMHYRFAPLLKIEQIR